jgi:hypothetical protein
MTIHTKHGDRREELNIVDVQLQMSTLEDVFLRIAKDCEIEEARRTNKTVTVSLKTNEQVYIECIDLVSMHF